MVSESEAGCTNNGCRAVLMAFGGTIASDMVECGAIDALRTSRQEYVSWYKNREESLMKKVGLSRKDFCSTFLFLKQTVGGSSDEELAHNIKGKKVGECWGRGRTKHTAGGSAANGSEGGMGAVVDAVAAKEVGGGASKKEGSTVAGTEGTAAAS